VVRCLSKKGEIGAAVLMTIRDAVRSPDGLWQLTYVEAQLLCAAVLFALSEPTHGRSPATAAVHENSQ
jgi:hypothetical protein